MREMTNLGPKAAPMMMGTTNLTPTSCEVCGTDIVPDDFAVPGVCLMCFEGYEAVKRLLEAQQNHEDAESTT